MKDPHGLLPAVQSLVLVLIASLFIMTFLVQPIRIPSSSMEPTLLVGDFLLLDRHLLLGRWNGALPPDPVSRGDVIVFHDPVQDHSIHLVKRVVGLPGDRLHLRDGIVYLNGVALREPYAVYRGHFRDAFRDDFPNLQSTDAGVDPAWWARLRGLTHVGDITVPPGQYFVLGDNRNDSEDSRYWGFVPASAVVGKPLVIYFSARTPTPGDPAPPTLGTFARWNRTFHLVR